jgi:hypothetical protein
MLKHPISILDQYFSKQIINRKNKQEGYKIFPKHKSIEITHLEGKFRTSFA